MYLALVNTKYAELEIRLDWSEMDLYGHINNVSYFKYIQASRVHFWELIGLNEYHREEGIGPILARTMCDFLMPLHFPGRVTIQAKTGLIGNHSFEIHHQLFNDKQELVAKATDVIVIYDFDKKQKSAIPDFLIRALEEFD